MKISVLTDKIEIKPNQVSEGTDALDWKLGANECKVVFSTPQQTYIAFRTFDRDLSPRVLTDIYYNALQMSPMLTVKTCIGYLKGVHKGTTLKIEHLRGDRISESPYATVYRSVVNAIKEVSVLDSGSFWTTLHKTFVPDERTELFFTLYARREKCEIESLKSISKDTRDKINRLCDIDAILLGLNGVISSLEPSFSF